MKKNFLSFFLISILVPLAFANGIDQALKTRIYFDHYKIHLVLTTDGIRLQMLELLDHNNRPMTKAPPYILQHGLAGNWNNWVNEADLLRQQGKRIFIPNWRGHGQGSTQSVARDGTSPDLDSRLSFDNLAPYDVPALLNYVYQLCDSKKVHWIGHSMGGMMMHLALAGVSKDTEGNLILSEQRKKEIESRLASFVAVGAPVSIPKTVAWKMAYNQWASFMGIRLDMSNVNYKPSTADFILDRMYENAKFFNPIPGLFNIENVSRKDYGLQKIYMGSNVPLPLLQSVDFYVRGYKSTDGKINYEKLSMQSPRSSVPTFIVSGERDVLATLESQTVMARQRHLPQIILLNTGHMDLIIGEGSKDLILILNQIESKFQ